MTKSQEVIINTSLLFTGEVGNGAEEVVSIGLTREVFLAAGKILTFRPHGDKNKK